MLDRGGKRDADRDKGGDDDDENGVCNLRVGWCCAFHGLFVAEFRDTKMLSQKFRGYPLGFDGFLLQALVLLFSFFR